jgi:NADPH:quinone reductase-like Zn-dependent oxidoreductase
MVIPTLSEGTWADRVVVAADAVIPLPPGIDVAQGAMAGVNPVTARLLLDAAGPLAPGQWIAQTAANSAVGQYLVQLARLAGIRTVNVVRRPEAAGALRDLGADAVVIAGDTLRGDVREALGEHRLEAVFDCVGGASTLTLSRFLRSGGSLISYGAVGADPVMVLPRDLIFRGVSVRGFWLITWLRETDPGTVRSAYQQVAGLIADGTLHAPVEASYDLSRYREAFTHAERPGRTGKILLTMNGH